jgi:putative ABC transport system permease protein
MTVRLLSSRATVSDTRTFADSILFEIKFALRTLLRDRSYAAASVVMLALALTLNTTVYTVMDAVLFRGFPQVQRNDRLLYLQEHDRLGRCCIAYADVRDWQREASSFQDTALVGGRSIALRDAQGRSMDLRVTTVDTNLFNVLGVAPALGRDFVAADATAGAPPVLILSDRAWHARFAARPEIVGSFVQIDNAAAQIVGVMPEGFEFTESITDGVWMPIVSSAELVKRGLTAGGFTAVARLRDGVTRAAATAELETIAGRLAVAYPDSNRDLRPTAVDYAQFISGNDARVIWGTMWAGACLVLLIACANVANLTLVRTVGRWREFTTCLALGAGRQRLVRQIAIEGAALSSAAALLSWPLIGWSMAQWRAVAYSPYQLVDYSMNAATMIYLAAITTLAAVLLSLGPIVRVLHLSAGGTFTGDARGVTQGHRTTRVLSGLVAGQMALAIVLLAGSGVLIRSFTNIVRAQTGVRNPESILSGRLRMPSATYPTPQARMAYLDRVQAKLRSVAGVEQVSMSGGLPVKFTGNLREVELEGRPSVSGERVTAPSVTTAPGYFAVIGAALLNGRDFTNTDLDSTQPVAIVNERFASLHWPGQPAVGQRLRTIDGGTPGPWRVVVGVVSNIMNAEPLRQQFKPLLYFPMRQEPPTRTAFFVARTTFPAATEVRTSVTSLDGDVRLDYFDTLAGLFAFDRDNMDAGHSELGKYSKAAPVFAIIALLLATTGLVAVIAHSVSQRTREIGLRMAIGASSRDIAMLIVSEGMRPVATGLVLGIGAAFGVNRILQSQLVAVSPSDPIVLISVSVLLVAVAMAACRLPARRALRVDPAIALRSE